MFSLRIVSTCHSQAQPIPDLDVTYSTFQSADVRKVPILHIFGSTPAGQKTCMHVHGVFPYLYVPYDGTLPLDSYLRRFALSLDKAINVANNNGGNTQHVFKISLVSGIPMYGYHAEEQQFLKIYMYNPNSIRKAADLLLGGAVMNKSFQPHESHIPYPLQLFIDFNLYGMNLINVSAVKFRRNKIEKRGGLHTKSNFNNSSKGGTVFSSLEQSRTPCNQSFNSSSNTPSMQVWDINNIQNDLLLPTNVEKLSSCELEVDIVAADILNRLELDANLGGNPGLAALWEDERQRRRDNDQSSVITPPDSQDHNAVEIAESERDLMQQLAQIIRLQEASSVVGEGDVSQQDSTLSQNNRSCIMASQIDLHTTHSEHESLMSSQDTLIFPGSGDQEEKEEDPVISLESIQHVVSFSQSFSQPLSQHSNSSADQEDRADRTLVEVLAALAEESSPAGSQQSIADVTALEDRDSILGQITILPPDAEALEEDEKETLEMSQIVQGNDAGISDDQTLDKNENFDLDGMDSTWNDSLIHHNMQANDSDDRDEENDNIPQFDGSTDEKPANKSTKKRLGIRGPILSSGSFQPVMTSGTGVDEQGNMPQSTIYSNPMPIGQQSQPAYGQNYSQGRMQWSREGRMSDAGSMSSYPTHGIPSAGGGGGPGYGSHGGYSNLYSGSGMPQAPGPGPGYGYYQGPHLQSSFGPTPFATQTSGAGVQGGEPRFQFSPKHFSSPPPPQSPISPTFYPGMQEFQSPGSFIRMPKPSSSPQHHSPFTQAHPSQQTGSSGLRRHSEGNIVQPPAHGIVSSYTKMISPQAADQQEAWSSPWQSSSPGCFQPINPSSRTDTLPASQQPSTLQALLEAPDISSSRTSMVSPPRHAASATIKATSVNGSSQTPDFVHPYLTPESRVSHFKLPEKRSASFSGQGGTSGPPSALSSLFEFVSSVDPTSITPISTPTLESSAHSSASSPSVQSKEEEEEETKIYMDLSSSQTKTSAAASLLQSQISRSISLDETSNMSRDTVTSSSALQWDTSGSILDKLLRDDEDVKSSDMGTIPSFQGSVKKVENERLGKQSRMKKLGLSLNRGRKLADDNLNAAVPQLSSAAYTYTFHVPTPVYKRLKMRGVSLQSESEIKVVRMHPMDARRYSLLKIGRELVRVYCLTPHEISNICADLRGANVSVKGRDSVSPVHNSQIDPQTGEMLTETKLQSESSQSLALTKNVKSKKRSRLLGPKCKRKKPKIKRSKTMSGVSAASAENQNAELSSSDAVNTGIVWQPPLHSYKSTGCGSIRTTSHLQGSDLGQAPPATWPVKRLPGGLSSEDEVTFQGNEQVSGQWNGSSAPGGSANTWGSWQEGNSSHWSGNLSQSGHWQGEYKWPSSTNPQEHKEYKQAARSENCPPQFASYHHYPQVSGSTQFSSVSASPTSSSSGQSLPPSSPSFGHLNRMSASPQYPYSHNYPVVNSCGVERELFSSSHNTLVGHNQHLGQRNFSPQNTYLPSPTGQGAYPSASNMGQYGPVPGVNTGNIMPSNELGVMFSANRHHQFMPCASDHKVYQAGHRNQFMSHEHSETSFNNGSFSPPVSQSCRTFPHQDAPHVCAEYNSLTDTTGASAFLDPASQTSSFLTEAACRDPKNLIADPEKQTLSSKGSSQIYPDRPQSDIIARCTDLNGSKSQPEKNDVQVQLPSFSSSQPFTTFDPKISLNNSGISVENHARLSKGDHFLCSDEEEADKKRKHFTSVRPEQELTQSQNNPVAGSTTQQRQRRSSCNIDAWAVQYNQRTSMVEYFSSSLSEDSNSQDSSDDCYRPTGKAGVKRQKKRRSKNMRRRAKRTSVDYRPNVFSRFLYEEKEEKRTNVIRKCNKKQGNPQLVEGIHYIVVGKFKGHRIMLVKVHRLKLDLDQRVNVNKWLGCVSDKRESITKCRSTDDFPYFDDSAAENQEGDYSSFCVQYKAAGKESSSMMMDEVGNWSDSSTIVDSSDLNFNNKTLQSVNQLKQKGNDTFVEINAFEQVESLVQNSEKQKPTVLSLDCRNDNISLTLVNEETKDSDEDGSENKEIIDCTDQEIGHNADSSSIQKKDSGLEMCNDLEDTSSSETESNTDKDDPEEIEPGLCVPNKACSMSSANNKSEENEMDDANQNSQKWMDEDLASQESNPASSNKLEVVILSDAREPVESATPANVQGKHPTDSSSLVSQSSSGELSQDADCSSLPQSNPDSQTSSPSSTRTSFSKSLKTKHKVHFDNELFENNSHGSEPKRAFSNPFNLQICKKVKSKEQHKYNPPVHEDSSDSSDSPACFSQFQEEIACKKPVRACRLQHLTILDAESKRQKQLTPNQRLGVAFLPKKKTRRKNIHIGKKKGLSGTGKLMNSLSLLHMATLASLSETHPGVEDGDVTLASLSDAQTNPLNVPDGKISAACMNKTQLGKENRDVTSPSPRYSDAADDHVSIYHDSLNKMSYTSPFDSDKGGISPPEAISPEEGLKMCRRKEKIEVSNTARDLRLEMNLGTCSVTISDLKAQKSGQASIGNEKNTELRHLGNLKNSELLDLEKGEQLCKTAGSRNKDGYTASFACSLTKSFSQPKADYVSQKPQFLPISPVQSCVNDQLPSSVELNPLCPSVLPSIDLPASKTSDQRSDLLQLAESDYQVSDSNLTAASEMCSPTKQHSVEGSRKNPTNQSIKDVVEITTRPLIVDTDFAGIDVSGNGNCYNLGKNYPASHALHINSGHNSYRCSRTEMVINEMFGVKIKPVGKTSPPKQSYPSPIKSPRLTTSPGKNGWNLYPEWNSLIQSPRERNEVPAWQHPSGSKHNEVLAVEKHLLQTSPHCSPDKSPISSKSVSPHLSSPNSNKHGKSDLQDSRLHTETSSRLVEEKFQENEGHVSILSPRRICDPKLPNKFHTNPCIWKGRNDGGIYYCGSKDALYEGFRTHASLPAGRLPSGSSLSPRKPPVSPGSSRKNGKCTGDDASEKNESWKKKKRSVGEYLDEVVESVFSELSPGKMTQLNSANTSTKDSFDRPRLDSFSFSQKNSHKSINLTDFSRWPGTGKDMWKSEDGERSRSSSDYMHARRTNDICEGTKENTPIDLRISVCKTQTSANYVDSESQISSQPSTPALQTTYPSATSIRHHTWNAVKSDNFENITDDEEEDISLPSQKFAANYLRFSTYSQLDAISPSRYQRYGSHIPVNIYGQGLLCASQVQDTRSCIKPNKDGKDSSGVMQFVTTLNGTEGQLPALNPTCSTTVNSLTGSEPLMTSSAPVGFSRYEGTISSSVQSGFRNSFASQNFGHSYVSSITTPWQGSHMHSSVASTNISSKFEPITDSEPEDEGVIPPSPPRQSVTRNAIFPLVSMCEKKRTPLPDTLQSKVRYAASMGSIATSSSNIPLASEKNGVAFPLSLSTASIVTSPVTPVTPTEYSRIEFPSQAPYSSRILSPVTPPSDASPADLETLKNTPSFAFESQENRWTSKAENNSDMLRVVMDSSYSRHVSRPKSDIADSSRTSLYISTPSDCHLTTNKTLEKSQNSLKNASDVSTKEYLVTDITHNKRSIVASLLSSGCNVDERHSQIVGEPQDVGQKCPEKPSCSKPDSGDTKPSKPPPCKPSQSDKDKDAHRGCSRKDKQSDKSLDSLSSGTKHVLCPKMSPPARQHVQATALSLGLQVEKVIKPFCSNPADLPSKLRELGGNQVLRLASFRVADIEDMSCDGRVGLGAWQSQLMSGSAFMASQSPANFMLKDKSENALQLHHALMGDAQCIITPTRPAPSWAAVNEWIHHKLNFVTVGDQDRQLIRENLNINKPETQSLKSSSSSPTLGILPDSDSEYSNEEERTEFTKLRTRKRSLSELTLAHPSVSGGRIATELVTEKVSELSTPNKRQCSHSSEVLSSTPKDNAPTALFEPITPTTDKLYAKEINPGDFVTPQHRPLRRLSTNTELALRRAIFTSHTKEPSDLDKSQIDGPTPKNTQGFKVTQQKMQDTKALHKHQYLTVLCMELHADSRGDLVPDPEVDAIRVIFYAVFDDIPPEKGLRNIKGAIIVDEQSCSLTESTKVDCSKPSTSSNITSPGDGGRRTLLQKCGVLEDLNVTYVRTELDLLIQFMELNTKLDPDILLGFEIQQLSWGFLLQRAAYLNLDLCSRLARFQGSKYGNHASVEKDEWGADHMSEIHIDGRIVLNLWRVLRHEVTLNIYTFENCAYHILHRRIPTYSFRSLSFWYNHSSHLHLWRVLGHYLERVTGQLAMLDQLDIIGKTSEFARVFGIEFFHVLSRGSQYRVESMMLRLAKPLNFIPVSPGMQQRARQKALECIPLNLEPESRFYVDPVVVLDFQSLYPSIMIAYNYCFSTCLGRLQHLATAHEGSFEFGCTSLSISPSTLKKLEKDVTISPNGCVFVKHHIRRGILPMMVDEILRTRLMIKKCMKDHKDDKVLKKMLDARQLGLKLIANVTFGYTAASFSGRMSCVEVADSILRKARESLECAIRIVENTSRWGGRVVYGDTDSLFIVLAGRTKQQAFSIGQEIADTITNIFPKPMKLRFEKVYLPCVLQTKKRYVGFMFETTDQAQPVFDAKGIETVRRDNCGVVSKMLEKCIKILFTSRDLSVIRKYVQHQFTKMLEGRIGLQDFIFAKEYRGMKGYKPGACVPALEIARRRLKVDRRSEPQVGERVPYVVVHGSPGLPLIQLVKQPQELMRDPALRINIQYYITKQVLPALGRVLGLCGIDMFEWYSDMPRIVRIAPQTLPDQEKKQGTIAQYFATSDCPLCDQQTKQTICPNCMTDPQCVAVTLTYRCSQLEADHHHLSQVCFTCMGTRDQTQPCTSLDCPVLFRRHRATYQLMRAEQLRETLQKMIGF